MSLEELRKRIDALDSELVRLIGERVRLAREIGGEKRACARQINDWAREKAVMAHIKTLAQEEGISPDAIERIYEEIITF